MVDPSTGPDRPVDEARVRRWWPGPRFGAWSFAMQMAFAVTVAALLTAGCVIAALLLDSHAGSWKGPVVFVVGVLTVAFYGWALYSTLHPLPKIQARPPDDGAAEGSPVP